MGKEVLLPYCTRCLQKEALYQKVYVRNGTKLQSPSKFYFCHNKDCTYYLDIQLDTIIETMDDKFYWVRVM